MGTEVASQATQTGFQAVVASVQTQAANLGASGLIAVGSAGAFQVEHMVDNSFEVYEQAAPMVAELVETGTIIETLPPESSFQGKELKPVGKVLGVKVGEERKQAIKEKEERKQAKQEAKQEKAQAKEVAKAEKEVAKEEEEAAKEEAKNEELQEKLDENAKVMIKAATPFSSREASSF